MKELLKQLFENRQKLRTTWFELEKLISQLRKIKQNDEIILHLENVLFEFDRTINQMLAIITFLEWSEKND